MPKKKYKNKQSVRGASWQARDPFYEREAAQYDKPVPSREYILQIIQSADVPLSFAKLSRAMGVSDEQDLVAVDRRLQAMQRDGQILKNRRGNFVFVNEEDLVRGRVIAHSDGYGFLVPDEGGDDI